MSPLQALLLHASQTPKCHGAASPVRHRQAKLPAHIEIVKIERVQLWQDSIAFRPGKFWERGVAVNCRPHARSPQRLQNLHCRLDTIKLAVPQLLQQESNGETPSLQCCLADCHSAHHFTLDN